MAVFLKRIGWELWLPIVVVVAWLLYSWNSESFYFPPLRDILDQFRQDWFFDHMKIDMWPSLRRLFAGFICASVLGVVAGLVLGIWRPLEAASSAVTEFFRSMPGVAVLPIMILLFGLGDEMKTIMIGFGAFFPVLLNTIDGVQSLDPMLDKVARGYHIGIKDRMRYMYFPAAAPQVFAGARIGLSISVMAMVVAEMVGVPGGVGYYVLDEQRLFKISGMWGGIILLGILGYVLNKLFLVLENRVLAWHRGMNAQQG